MFDPGLIGSVTGKPLAERMMAAGADTASPPEIDFAEVFPAEALTVIAEDVAPAAPVFALLSSSLVPLIAPQLPKLPNAPTEPVSSLDVDVIAMEIDDRATLPEAVREQAKLCGLDPASLSLDDNGAIRETAKPPPPELGSTALSAAETLIRAEPVADALVTAAKSADDPSSKATPAGGHAEGPLPPPRNITSQVPVATSHHGRSFTMPEDLLVGTPATTEVSQRQTKNAGPPPLASDYARDSSSRSPPRAEPALAKAPEIDALTGGAPFGETASPKRGAEAATIPVVLALSIASQPDWHEVPQAHFASMRPEVRPEDASGEVRFSWERTAKSVMPHPTSTPTSEFSSVPMLAEAPKRLADTEAAVSDPVGLDSGLSWQGGIATTVAGNQPSATIAAASPGPNLPVLAAQIVEKLVQNPDGSTTLTLSPEELGRVRLSFQLDGQNPDRIVVMLAFDRPDTLDLFRRHADQLAEALRATGYGGVQLDFGAMGDRKPQTEPAESVPDDSTKIESVRADDLAPVRGGAAGIGALDLRL